MFLLSTDRPEGGDCLTLGLPARCSEHGRMPVSYYMLWLPACPCGQRVATAMPDYASIIAKQTPMQYTAAALQLHPHVVLLAFLGSVSNTCDNTCHVLFFTTMPTCLPAYKWPAALSAAPSPAQHVLAEVAKHDLLLLSFCCVLTFLQHLS